MGALAADQWERVMSRLHADHRSLPLLSYASIAIGLRAPYAMSGTDRHMLHVPVYRNTETGSMGTETGNSGTETRYGVAETGYTGTGTRYGGTETGYTGAETRHGVTETGYTGTETR
eukprot:1830608-Rhodomonas_salina.1